MIFVSYFQHENMLAVLNIKAVKTISQSNANKSAAQPCFIQDLRKHTLPEPDDLPQL